VLSDKRDQSPNDANDDQKAQCFYHNKNINLHTFDTLSRLFVESLVFDDRTQHAFLTCEMHCPFTFCLFICVSLFAVQQRKKMNKKQLSTQIATMFDPTNYSDTIAKTTRYLEKIDCMCLNTLQCRALAYMQSGKEIESIQDMRKILFLKGPAGPVYCNLGIILMRHKYYKEAIVGFQKASKEEPTNPSYMWNIAWTYSLINDLESAISYGKKSVELCRSSGFELQKMRKDLSVSLSLWEKKLQQQKLTSLSTTTTSAAASSTSSAAAATSPATTTSATVTTPTAMRTSPITPSTNTSAP
jgi:tetratricopeptide (TPR) repeat protein